MFGAADRTFRRVYFIICVALLASCVEMNTLVRSFEVGFVLAESKNILYYIRIYNLTLVRDDRQNQWDTKRVPRSPRSLTAIYSSLVRSHILNPLSSHVPCSESRVYRQNLVFFLIVRELQHASHRYVSFCSGVYHDASKLWYSHKPSRS